MEQRGVRGLRHLPPESYLCDHLPGPGPGFQSTVNSSQNVNFLPVEPNE